VRKVCSGRGRFNQENLDAIFSSSSFFSIIEESGYVSELFLSERSCTDQILARFWKVHFVDESLIFLLEWFRDCSEVNMFVSWQQDRCEMTF
jgi:hypothetical protein